MTEKNPQYDLYEKLYFHEIEAREHINARLQLPLALIISLTTALAFLLQHLNNKLTSLPVYIFLGLLSVSLFFLIIASIYFVRSMFGTRYAFLPDCEATEKYKEELSDTYKDVKDGSVIASDYFNKYIFDYFIKCSSRNARANDRRSGFLYNASAALVATTFFAGLAFLIFYFYDLEKKPSVTIHQLSISEPLEVKMIEDDKPKDIPPPPPPPPERLIKEDKSPKETTNGR